MAITSYLNSSSVTVFPSAKRAAQSDSYKSSRLLGEKTTTNILQHIARYPSYVLSNEFSVNSLFEFILGGYYFGIVLSSTDLSTYQSANAIYATISLDTTDDDFPELEGVDTDLGAYTGLKLNDGTATGSYSLKILSKDTAGTWVIPKNSKHRLAYENINILESDIIDGGIVQ